MSLRIYNSLTRKKELFEPLEPGKVRMYVCGPTVYDEPHIGHLRSAYVFQVIRSYLKHSGYEVKFVRNVTDVDDKIIEKARQQGYGDLKGGVREISEKYHRMYIADLCRLGVDPPDAEPRATNHIAEMIDMIRALEKSGHAYCCDGDVYFEVNAFSDYGKLSHQTPDAMLEAVRIDPNEKKNTPLDFALWKKAKEDEPSWDSPWGKGRPGWHIECSAMSRKHLGDGFDIHGGGLDLLFPHHENEIAQSRCVTGRPLMAAFWMHHGLVTVNGQKMSKSLGNFVTLGDAVKSSPDWGIEELKFLFLSAHYRAPLDYSAESMTEAKAVRERFVHWFRELARISPTRPVQSDALREREAHFRNAMEDDFNTPEALAALHGMVDDARKSGNASVKMTASQKIRELGSLFGLSFGVTHKISLEDTVKVTAEISPVRVIQTVSLNAEEQEEIERLIRERDEARKKKDFKKSDAIRERLLKEKRVVLMDDAAGTTWRRL